MELGAEGVVRDVEYGDGEFEVESLFAGVSGVEVEDVVDGLVEGLVGVAEDDGVRCFALDAAGEGLGGAVHIDDVVDAWMAALGMPRTPSPVYNLGTARKTTVQELLRTLIAVMGLDPAHPIRELPGSVFDQMGLVADISLAERELNWRPKVDLMEGLNKMVVWAGKEVT